MNLRALVDASSAIAATRARKAKVETLAALLGQAAPEEIAPVVSWLSGELTQRQIGVGWALLKDRPAPASEATLTVAEVEAALSKVGGLRGAGSQAARRAALSVLFTQADAGEQAFLVRLLLGDLRQGALAGVMTDAVAKAAAVPLPGVRRALTLHGNLADVASIALTQGADGLASLRLEVGRPVAPMLAGSAPDVATAMDRIAPAAVEWKLDGARVQVHRDELDVAIFTRSLDDVTARLPEVVEAVLALPAQSVVLDGEAIALRGDGRPEPFQVTAARFGTAQGRTHPLDSFFFDVLHLDGQELLDEPLARRSEALDGITGAQNRIPRVVAEDAASGQAAMDAAIAAGHEGVMVKDLDAPYAAGRRGSGWLKVKPVHTLDLVVLAAEWGHGRRRGRLSNLHLGARVDGPAKDLSGGSAAEPGWAMVGKTFKGLTDDVLAWQTEQLLAREVRRDGIAVIARPELVVEIAFDGVQTSSRYPSGVALRFARVKRYRADKTAADADTLETVKAIRDGVA